MYVLGYASDLVTASQLRLGVWYTRVFIMFALRESRLTLTLHNRPSPPQTGRVCLLETTFS